MTTPYKRERLQYQRNQNHMDISNLTPDGTLPFQSPSIGDVAEVATKFRAGSTETQSLIPIIKRLKVLEIGQESACHVDEDSAQTNIASVPESVDITMDISTDHPPQDLVLCVNRDCPSVSTDDFSDDVLDRYVEFGDLDEQNGAPVPPLGWPPLLDSIDDFADDCTGQDMDVEKLDGQCEALLRRAMQSARRKNQRRARRSDCERGSTFKRPLRKKVGGASRHRHNIPPRIRW